MRGFEEVLGVADETAVSKKQRLTEASKAAG